MEPVTHFMTGACLARSGFNRKTAYATLAMILAAEAPDLDVFWSVQGPVAGFQHHRGITHTFIGAPFVALTVTGVLWLWHRFRRNKPAMEPHWGWVWGLSWVAALSHIFMDWTNNYGVRPLFPLNPRWYSLDIAFILEPVVFGALLLGLVMPWILGLADREIGAARPALRGRGWAMAAVILVGIDLGVRAVEHHRALHLISNLRFGEQATVSLAAEPFPINPFRWYAIVETPGYFQTGMVDTWKETVVTSDRDDVVFKPPVTPAVAAAKQSWLGKVYLDWARFPITTDRGPASLIVASELAPAPQDTAVEFRDLRFAAPVLPGGRDRNAALRAWVYVGPQGAIDAMVMNGREQK